MNPRKPEHFEWRYLSRGKAIHALSSPTSAIARCGTGPVWFDSSAWMGTGSQAEYETAEALPRCKRCVKLIGGGAS